MRTRFRIAVAALLVATTAGADERLHARETWRISGQDDRFLFGVVSRAIADGDGYVYLLDSQLSEVTVLDPAGAFVRRIGGEGDGPGGLRRPADVFLYPNGDVGVVMLSPAKIVRFDADGTFRAEATPSMGGRPLRLLNAAASVEGLIGIGIQSRFEAGSRTTTYALGRLDDTGALTIPFVEGGFTLSYERLHIDERALDLPEARWALAPDGTVFVAPDRDAYRIRVFDSSGTPMREWSLPSPPVARSEAARSDAEARLRQMYRHARYQRATFAAADTDPVVRAMRVSADGNLWIDTASAREEAVSAFTAYDVVSVDGRRLGRVSVDVPGDPREDALHWLSDDRVVVVQALKSADEAMSGVGEGAPDERAPDIVCYALTPAR